MAFDPRLTKRPAGALRPIIPDNARIPRITAAAGTELADAYSLGHVRQQPATREVSYYALFKGLLLLSSPPACLSLVATQPDFSVG